MWPTNSYIPPISTALTAYLPQAVWSYSLTCKRPDDVGSDTLWPTLTDKLGLKYRHSSGFKITGTTVSYATNTVLLEVAKGLLRAPEIQETPGVHIETT